MLPPVRARRLPFVVLLVVVAPVVAGIVAVSAQNAQSKTVKDVVCGMNVNPETTKYKTTHEGTTYYFCSDSCLQKFTKEPAKYVKAAPKTAKDPVCGMTVETANAKYKTTHEGTTYYFCSDSCLQKFTKEPAKYVK